MFNTTDDNENLCYKQIVVIFIYDNYTNRKRGDWEGVKN